MTWVKVSDTFDTDRQVERVSLEAVGLLIRALTYSARYLLDGEIDDGWLKARIPAKKRRDRIVAELVDAGIFKPRTGGHLIANWTDFHFSKAEEEERKRKERDKKARQRREKRGDVPAGHPGESPSNVVGSGQGEGRDGGSWSENGDDPWALTPDELTPGEAA